MKLLLVGLLTMSAFAQEKIASLPETTDWIRSTLARHGNTIEKKGRTTDSERIENLQFEECTLRASYVFESSYNASVVVSVTHDATVPLSDIDHIETTSKSGHWMVSLQTKGKSIKGEMRTGLPGQYSRQPLAVSEFQIPCDDKTIAERLKTALLHAVDLCKKQKEPF